MNATINRPHTAMITTADEPLADTAHDDLGAIAGYPATDDAYTQRRKLETDLLIALAWAPADMVTTIVHALVGDLPHRVAAGSFPDDRIPTSHPLFLDAGTRAVFDTITAFVDTGKPVTPATLRAAHTDRRAAAVLLEIASPSGRPPLPGSPEAPHLAIELVEHWYRAGYLAFTAHLAAAGRDARDDDGLARHRDKLIAISHTADTRRHAVITALGRI